MITLVSFNLLILLILLTYWRTYLTNLVQDLSKVLSQCIVVLSVMLICYLCYVREHESMVVTLHVCL